LSSKGDKQMRKFAIVAIALVAAAIGLLTLYKLKYPTYTYRYRMAMEVDTGGEIRSGSSVIEVNVSRQPQFLPEVSPYDRWARGQAIFVELPGGKNLVAVLASGARGENGDYPIGIVQRVFRAPLENIPSLSGSKELNADQFPTLVTVGDPSDSKTAHVVSPSSLENTLGVRLRSIVLEMTKDSVSPVTIDTRLPFLVDEERKRIQITDPNIFIPRSSIFIRR
jgi:hypothetical protein